MPLEDFETRVFLAPRSNESSYDNFQSTIQDGFDYKRIEPYLDEAGKQILHKEAAIYAWGNRDSKKSGWDKIQTGDTILFYRKGIFVMAGTVIYKQYSEAISDALWPRLEKYGNQPWSCVYFVNQLRPVSIKLEVINELGDYGLIALQGFQPLNEAGLQKIIDRFESVDNFINAYGVGADEVDLARLSTIAAKEDKETTAEDLEQIDTIVGDQEIEEIISVLYARNTSSPPERITAKVEKLRRDFALVVQLKRLYNDECQVCGTVIKKKKGGRYSEVAHIKLWARAG